MMTIRDLPFLSRPTEGVPEKNVVDKGQKTDHTTHDKTELLAQTNGIAVRGKQNGSK